MSRNGPEDRHQDGRALITGGAGFIGSNLADRLLGRGHRITILDDLSMPGGRHNIEWLRSRHPGDLRVVCASLTDVGALADAMRGAAWIFHLASQVAVTSSIADPRADFEANALGTFNVLEAARALGTDPIVVYSSTNKVYGSLADVRAVEDRTRYRYVDLLDGIPEGQPLDFLSPYGCSKGAGDQYVRDYHRIYGLRTVVVRQSCIYGPRQFGREDQGWLTWFIVAALRGDPITIFGDGKQVRDVLHVDDLLDAYDAMVATIDRSAGQVYNIGGGPANSLSVWAELAPLLEGLLARPIPARHLAWRPGDQRIFVADIRKAARDLGWAPRVSAAEGIGRQVDWVRTHLDLFSARRPAVGDAAQPRAPSAG